MPIVKFGKSQGHAFCDYVKQFDTLEPSNLLMLTVVHVVGQDISILIE